MYLLKQNRDFRFLWIASSLEGAASNILQFILSLYVLDLTQSPTAFAGILAIVVFPNLLVTPLAGVLGDRLDRKKSLLVTTLLNSLLLLLAGVFALWQGVFPLVAIYFLVIGLEIVEILRRGPLASMLPALVSTEDLAKAQALMELDNGIVQVLSPILGALFYQQVGMAWSLVITAGFMGLVYLLYLAMVIPARKQDVPAAQSHPFSTLWQDFKEGLAFIWTLPNMVVLSLVALSVNFIIAPVSGLVLTYFVRVVLQLPLAQYSAYETARAVIILVTPLIVYRLAGQDQILVRLRNGLVGIFLGQSLIVLAVWIGRGSLLASMGLLLLSDFVCILACLYINIFMNTWMMTIVPENYMSRIGSTMGLLSTISVPLGQVVFGFLLEGVGPLVTILLAILAFFFILCIYQLKVIQRKDVSHEFSSGQDAARE